MYMMIIVSKTNMNEIFLAFIKNNRTKIMIIVMIIMMIVMIMIIIVII